MQRFNRRKFCTAAVGAGAAGWALSARQLHAAADEAVDLSQRFCVCNELFGDWPLEKALGLAADCGYRGLEIAPFTIDKDVRRVSGERRGRIRRLAEGAGLTIVGLHWLLAKTEGLHLTSPDREVRRRTADYLGALARFCADLGGRLLVFGSPRQRNLLPGVSYAQAERYAAEVFRETLPVLEETGTTLALEPLSPKTTTFVSTAAQGMRVVDLVDSDRCQLNLDCLAMSTESTSITELIRAHRAQLAHFHANDPNAQGPGFGRLDFVPIFRTLREVDYRGWVSVEVFDYSPGIERLARSSIRHMRQCLAAAARQPSLDSPTSPDDGG